VQFCLSLVQRVLAPSVDRSSVGVVVQDIKALDQDFEAFSLSHVYRQFNESAHILARSVERYVFSVFRNFAPDCIWETLCNDLL
jgi:hypothetical protein